TPVSISAIVTCLIGSVVALNFVSAINWAHIAGIGVAGLGMADQYRIARQQPFPETHVRTSVAASGDEIQPTGLHVGNGAVGEQVPAFAQPDRGKIGLSEIKGRRVTVKLSDGARSVVVAAGAGGPARCSGGAVVRLRVGDANRGVVQVREHRIVDLEWLAAL